MNTIEQNLEIVRKSLRDRRLAYGYEHRAGLKASKIQLRWLIRWASVPKEKFERLLSGGSVVHVEAKPLRAMRELIEAGVFRNRPTRM